MREGLGRSWSWSIFSALLAVLLLPGGGPCLGSEAPGAVDFVAVSHQQLEDQLAGHIGDVVVVDYWATWCHPCIEGFAGMVELHRRYRDRGVTFVSVSLDDRTDEEALAFARRFLVEKGADFPNFLLDESIISSFERLGLLGIPAVDIFDRQGRRHVRLTTDDPNNQYTEEDVEDALRELLAEDRSTRIAGSS